MWMNYTGASFAAPGILEVTTSRFLYIWDDTAIAELGVMRPNGNFSAPYLWLVPLLPHKAPLRLLRAATNAIHELLFEPVFYAEARAGRDEHFLRFCGFTFVADLGDRLLVQKVSE